MWDALSRSFTALHSNLQTRRLLREDEGIEGCGVFHKRPDQRLHAIGNILRIISALSFSPLSLLIPRVVVPPISNYVRTSWFFKFTITPGAVLYDTREDRMGRYDITGFKPTWVLEVTIEGGRLSHYRQIAFTDDVEATGYTALSYPMKSAAVLFKEAGLVAGPAPAGRAYTLQDRQRISVELLRLYCSATTGSQKNADRTEYVWLDELCLSDHQMTDEDAIEQQRSVELGRLTDIFRKASRVGVFCHELDCNHTGLTCIWGKRLFTLPEILHAQSVLRMTRKRVDGEIVTRIYPTSAPAFRGAMQTQAAQGDRWHLYAIFQHSVNAGSVPWQSAIHALIVEAIRRDEAGGFRDHKFLGKALNGLLPRRACLQHLGSSGWNDLAWLLELNQGFYNAASLAALCSIADDESVSWLGKPIHPTVGNERLEPIVTAFPVTLLPRSSQETPEPHPPLSIIGVETLGLRSTLKRDVHGLYNNEEMKGLRRLAMGTSVLLGGISVYKIMSGNLFGVWLYLLTAVGYSGLEMLVGTMYLEKDGWIFLDDWKWGKELGDTLGKQDNTLRELRNWGNRQLAPQWEAPDPERRPWRAGYLVDLRSKVYVKTIVVGEPNAIVPLAIHGSGVTCMLLERSADAAKDPTFTARKVGMSNLPPYILSQTVKTGTIYVTSRSSESKTEKSGWFGFLRRLWDSCRGPGEA